MESRTIRGLGLALLAATFAACERESPSVQAVSEKPLGRKGWVEIPSDSPRLAQIKVEPVRLANVPSNEFTAPGTIELNPNRVSRVLLPVSGRIVEVKVHFGDAVSKGQPLLELESPDADAAISAFLQAEGAVTQAKAAVSKAQADYDRASDLFQNQAIAKKEVLRAETELTQAKVGLSQVQAAREQAARRLTLLGLRATPDQQKILVRAPLAGKVTEISVVAGEYRSDLATPLMTIADLSTVWVSVDVPESLIRVVHVGERLEVTLGAFPGETFRSHVARISDAVDPQNRTVDVWAELANPGGRLRPGMFGAIRHAETSRPTPVVPASAVIQADGRSMVFVERAKGSFEQVEVSLGVRQGNMIPLTGGVGQGQRVVVDGAMLLRGYR